MRRDSKVQCPEYLNFIRRKPCCACGASAPDAHHIKAKGLGSGKRSDFTAIPLDRICHSELHQVGAERFQQKHGVNLWQEATWCLTEFFLDDERRAGAIIITGKV